MGAVLYPVAAAILVGVTGAISAYIAYLSAVTMNAYRLAALLAVFLVTGVLTSMLTAEDPQWWQENLSALGMSSDVSGVAFNVTLIVAGVVVTTLAGYSTRTLESTASTASARRRVRQLEVGIILIGILLACVGLLPVDEQFWLHTAAASGMVVVFGTLIVRMRSLVPSIPATFNVLGLVFLAVIAFAVLMYFPVRLLQPHRRGAHRRLAGLRLADRPDPQPGRRRRRPARAPTRRPARSSSEPTPPASTAAPGTDRTAAES